MSYYKTHPDYAERRKERTRLWKKNNPEKVKIMSKNDYQKHKARRQETHKIWYRKNRERQLKLSKQLHLGYKMQVFSYYGGIPPKCACCGESKFEFLTLDHKNEDGAAHRRTLSKGRTSGLMVYRWILKHNFPEGFQILCWNCNCSKHFYGQCPHLGNSILFNEIKYHTNRGKKN